MKNVRLNYGTLIIDCEKAEVLMYIGKTSMHELWMQTVYSPKGGVISNQEEVKTFIPMFNAKIMKKEKLLTSLALHFIKNYQKNLVTDMSLH